MRVVIGGKAVRYYWHRKRGPKIIHLGIFGGERRHIPKPKPMLHSYGEHIKGKLGEVPDGPMPPIAKRWKTTWPEVWWFQVPGFYGNNQPNHA